MALVTFKSIGKEYAGRWVLENVFLDIPAGVKIGLIGANGSGKTTLLKILLEQVKPNVGSVAITADCRIGYVPQHVEFSGDQTVRQYLLQDHERLTRELRQKEAALAHAPADQMDRLLRDYEKVREQYDATGGDHFVGRAEEMLDALGLAGKADQSVRTLSGGEKNVLGLTHALLADPNLLILDEPGNHLDYLGLAWLEDFLNRFRGAILIVSHNRYLLDQVVERIWELEDGKVIEWRGNYSAYKKQKAEKLKAQHAEYKAYQQRLDHMKALVQKLQDYASGRASEQSWGKMLKARRSQLEKLEAEAMEKPQAQRAAVQMRFAAETSRADIALRLQGYEKAWDGKVLFESVDWDIQGSQRWALVGANGSGKTSLLRDVIELGKWEHPVIRIGPSLSVGYCAQEQEVLNRDNTVYDELLHLPDTTHEKVLGILARFLFTDEEVYKKVRDLSGGERNRLQLARLMILRPNFLILDEPTNHLDIPTCEAVEQALSEFDGTILVVSHDRYFLDKVVDHIAHVTEKRLSLFEGNYSVFWQRYQQNQTKITGRVATRRIERESAKKEKSKSGGEAWKQRKAAAAALRKAQKRVEDIEQQITDLETRQKELEIQIADAFSRSENDRGTQLSEELDSITARLNELHENWIQAGEELEQFQS